MSLYQKCRPTTFQDMIGSEDQIQSLSKTMARENRPHVFLFTGPAGSGKTTAARICSNMVGAGEMSIVEVNSSNNRGIDSARSIADQMRFAPVDGDATVFILDEVHQTTKDFQNALLKPTEDCPNHVYFFLCTTNPEKLIAPLKTRCTEFKFTAMSAEEISLLLRKVNRAENLGVGKEAILAIAENCDGGARKALQLLEKVAGIEDEETQLRLAEEKMTDEEDADTRELCQAILKDADWGTVAAIIKKMNVSDVEKVRYAVLGYMNAVLLNGKDHPKAALALEFFSEPFYGSIKYGITLAAYQTLHT
jgi:DNA polymerase III gamma/tau subunit